MKIVVCVKQVPDTTDIKWTENNTICREGLESIINPYDVCAVDAALRLKDKFPQTEVSAISMGPMQAEPMLRKLLALGVDNAFLLCDKKFAGSDTYATAKTLSAAIKKSLKNFDMIICGQFAVDGDTAQTGPGIASFLGIPQATYVKQIIECHSDYIIVQKETDDGEETLRLELPALVCLLKNEIEPRRASINGIISAQRQEIDVLNADDIRVPAEELGIKGSPTFVSKAFRPQKKEKVCSFVSDSRELLHIIEKSKGEFDE